MSRTFDPDTSCGRALFDWWTGLEQHRGDRAELRRCDTPLAVMMTTAFHYARRRLLERGLSDSQWAKDRLPIIVGLAAHVVSTPDRKNHIALPSLPDAFSRGDKSPVSPLRFRQILEARDDDERFTRVRRVLPLVGTQVNLFSLANDLYGWGDQTRKRWVYDYRWPSPRDAA